MHELITQFGIDWKLLLAQVVNFFILLFLLRAFAYRPIMNMLAERRQKIEEGMEASEASKKKLAETENLQKQILLQAHEKALGIVDHAEKDAEVHAKGIIAGAQAKGEQVIASGRKKLEEEEKTLSAEFEDHAEGLVRASLVKVIGKLEPAERDKNLIKEALVELKIISKTS
jgi:F-type H+-transporting ATPase subunit b